jgi:hypothetical protein
LLITTRVGAFGSLRDGGNATWNENGTGSSSYVTPISTPAGDLDTEVTCLLRQFVNQRLKALPRKISRDVDSGSERLSVFLGHELDYNIRYWSHGLWSGRFDAMIDFLTLRRRE